MGGGGKEGVKIAVGAQHQVKVVLVDECFPWWFSPAQSMDFKVTNVWLIDSSALDRFSVVGWKRTVRSIYPVNVEK